MSIKINLPASVHSKSLDKTPDHIYTVYMRNGRKRPDTKQEIGSAAIRLFENGGVRAVSMRKVAAEVGITPMAIYNHFENMEDLLLHVYKNGVRKLARSIRVAIGKQENVEVQDAEIGRASCRERV